MRIVCAAQVSRIVLRRQARRLALRAVHSGITEPLARLLAIFDRRRALLLRGSLAGIRRRHDDQSDFWKSAAAEFPGDPGLLRKLIDAALRAGRARDAEVALVRLIELGVANAQDCRYVVGLTHADQRTANLEGVRARIRRFLVRLHARTDQRVAAVRLSRLLFAYFPRKSADRLDPRVLRAQFLAMLDRSKVWKQPKALLRRVAECEDRLEHAIPASCFLFTDVLASQRREFIRVVRARLTRQEPFSFVRIGDGEAACMPYEPELAGLAPGDARERETIWWGAPLSEEVRARLAPAVARAIWDADAIGVPGLARFLRELQLQSNDSLERSLTGRGLRAILYCTERLGQLRSPALPLPIITSCHLHQELALWDCYGELLEGAGEVVLVSCHPGLADWVSDRFRVDIAGNLILPPDRVSAPLLRQRATENRSLPQILNQVIDRLGDLPRGRLVLVGAGYLGKLLVATARERGGIALDLGSVFDFWLGLRTRTYLDWSVA
jgi:hypothetical protein